MSHETVLQLVREISGLSVKLDMLLQKSDERNESLSRNLKDHETRIRGLEDWKIKWTVIAAAVSAGVALVVNLLVRILT